MQGMCDYQAQLKYVARLLQDICRMRVKLLGIGGINPHRLRSVRSARGRAMLELALLHTAQHLQLSIHCNSKGVTAAALMP